MHRTALSAAAGLLVLASLAAGQRRPIDLPWLRPDKGPPPTFPEIFLSVAQAAETELVPVDVRAAAAFAEEHLPRALQVELEGPCLLAGRECLARRLGAAGLSGGDGVLLYGDDPVAVGRLFWLLEWAGVSPVRVLDGGLDAWRREGHPTDSGLVPRVPATFRPGPASAREAHGPSVVDRGRVAGGFGEPGMELVDVRGAGAWAGTEGHVPHSLPYDFLALIDDPPRWPDPAAARRLFSRLGPRPTTHVDMTAAFVLYGDGPSDPRPGLGYLLLRAMGVDVAVYPGGWTDWLRTGPEAASPPVVRVVDALELAASLEADNPGLTDDRPPRGFVLFDVRATPDHRVGHLPGAISLPAQLCAEGVSEAVPQPEQGDRRDVPVVFYCYGLSCVRSRNCATRAARAGFGTVLWFREGVPAWQTAGLPLFRSPPAAPSRP